MLKSTEKIQNSCLRNHVIRETDLASLFQGTPARRYGLINKAIKKQEILVLRRGLYLLHPRYRLMPFSTYYLANHIVSYSFVSAESALQFHEWIPERVVQTISISAFGKNKQFNTFLGEFIYRKVSINSDNFWTGVNRIKINNTIVLMATPLRALADYIYLHKIENADWQFLKLGLRIEDENLFQLTANDIEALISVYHSKRVNQFLKKLLNEVKSRHHESNNQ